MMATVSRDEIFILKRMAEGDEKAFRYFFDCYYDDLCNFVNCYMRDESLSEDIVQGIFIDLWERRNTLKFDSSIKTYLFTVSKNKSLNSLRNQKCRSKIHDLLSLQQDEVASEKADSYLEYEELRDLLAKAIDNLPDQCKTIYQLSRNEGLSNREIAERLELSVKTVENQMTIGIRKIKEYLIPYYQQIFILFLFCKFY